MKCMPASGLAVLLIAVLMVLNAAGTRLGAQETLLQNGAIFGTISDKTGAVLPGATVEATSPALQGTKVATADAQGAYRISDLPAGTYRITYSKAGFETEVRSDFALPAGFSSRVDVALNPGSVQQTVEVTALAPVIDTSTAVISNTLTRTALDNMPTTRSLWAAVFMAPGVRPSNTPDIGGNQLGQQQNIESYGFEGNTVPLVDGVDVLQGDSLEGGGATGDFVDYDAESELRIISTSAGAEIGPPGPVVIAIFKSGGNEFHGDARGMKEWQGFQATNLPSTFSGGSTANQLTDFYDIFGDVGGRIIRDRLWFWGGAHWQRKNSAVIGYVGPNGGQGFDPLSQDNQEAKLTYQVTKNIKLIGSGSDGTKYESQRNGSNTVPYSSTFDQYDNYYTSKGELVWTPNGSLVADVLIGNYWQPYGYPNQPGVSVAGNPFSDNITTGQISGSNIQISSSDKGEHKRAQGTASLAYFRGKHSFQFGAMMFAPQADTKTFIDHPAGDYELKFDNVNGVTTPDQIVTFNFPSYAAGKEIALGLYAKDTWRASKRLTLNLGVRFDRYRGYHTAETEGGGQFYSAVKYPAQTDYIWKRVVPRIGAAYDFTGSGKTVVRGSWGIYSLDELGAFDISYYNPAAQIQNTYSWSGPCQVTKYTSCDATAATLSSLGTGTTTYLSTSGGAAGILNPDLKMPYMHEASADFERQLAPNLALRATYVYQRLSDIFDLTFPNRPPSSYTIPYTTTYPVQDPVNAGKPITILTYPASLVCPASTPLCPYNLTKLVTRTGNPNYFNTMEFTVTKQQSGKWMALASFDLTKNHQFLFTSPIFASGESAGNIQAPYQQAFPLDKTWDWSLKSYMSYDLPFRVELGLTYNLLKGSPNYRTDQFTKVPQLGTVTIPVEPWGTEWTPALNVLGVRLAKVFPIHETKSITGSLDLFNALNASPAETINYLSGTGASTFGTVSAVLPPLIGRLGVLFKF